MQGLFKRASSNTKAIKVYKTPGGYSAQQNKVTGELDEADQIIVSMKQAGYPDKAVRDKISEAGLVDYHVKTIATRWTRLQRLAQKMSDDKLDAELTDWHDGDVSYWYPTRTTFSRMQDECLAQAIAATDAQIAVEIQRLEAKKWQKVAQQLKKIKVGDMGLVNDFADSRSRLQISRRMHAKQDTKPSLMV